MPLSIGTILFLPSALAAPHKQPAVHVRDVAGSRGAVLPGVSQRAAPAFLGAAGAAIRSREENPRCQTFLAALLLTGSPQRVVGVEQREHAPRLRRASAKAQSHLRSAIIA